MHHVNQVTQKKIFYNFSLLFTLIQAHTMTFQETIYIFYLKLVKYDTFFQTKNIKDELFSTVYLRDYITNSSATFLNCELEQKLH